MGFLLSVVGVLLVLEGLPYFAFPRKTKEWAMMLGEIPDRSLRIMGLVAMVFGLLLIYAARMAYKIFTM
ncbi:MAG: DUF2065 domain-containing protein [Thermodesulfobacteriota bacterium]